MTKKNRKKPNRNRQTSPTPQSAAAVLARGDGGQASDRPRVQRLERRLTFRLDADRLTELESYAMREGFPVSLVIRHLVCRFLDDQRRYQGNR